MPASSPSSVSSKSLVRVVKVGGSLLGRADLPVALSDWLAEQPTCHTVLVAGGGKLVDVIREADRTHDLGEKASHWLAIAAMRVSARLLATLVPRATLVNSWNELRERVLSPGVTIFDAEQFLRQVEPHLPGKALPESWDVTSDSIAARLAIALAASELVLLKSAAPSDPSAGLSVLADSGYVDRFLPSLERELPQVRCIGLLSVPR